MTVTATLLTTPHCSLCDQAKEVLGRLESEGELEVEVVDLHSAEGEALAMRSGMAFPPGLLLDGEGFCYGRLSERKLRRELARRRRT